MKRAGKVRVAHELLAELLQVESIQHVEASDWQTDEFTAIVYDKSMPEVDEGCVIPDVELIPTWVTEELIEHEFGDDEMSKKTLYEYAIIQREDDELGDIDEILCGPEQVMAESEEQVKAIAMHRLGIDQPALDPTFVEVLVRRFS